MNPALFWRLLWKEYRMQRAFWIAMAALAVVASLLVLSLLQWNRVEERDWLFRVTLALGAFYALGCGGTLFAAEHDGETFSFQRALPVSALRLFAAKIVFALASTAAMLGAMWLVAAVLAGWRLPQPGEELGLWAVWGMGAVELLAWGVFFSLLTKRPLVAVILAVGCASVVVESLRGGVPADWDWSPYIGALPRRAIVVGLLALADLWLGYRWFHEPLAPGRRLARVLWVDVGESLSFVPWVAGTRWTVFGRLLWHHLRQSAPLLVTFIVLAAPMAFGVLLIRFDVAGRAIERLFRNAGSLVIPVYFFSVMLTPPLMGACAFLADQSRLRFRFLAERGVGPRPVWLSRQLVWFVPLALGATAILAPLMPEKNAPVMFFFGYAILGYACGQFFSMFCRSGILAAALAVGLTVGLCMWAGLMYEIHMSWWWSLAPVVLALLVSTWLRAGDWLVERPGVKPVLRACSPLIFTSAAILVAVPTVRVYEIPYVDPGFSPEEYARPRTADEEATLAIYRRALAALKDSRGAVPPRPFEAALTLALEASRRPACDFFDLEPGGISPTEVRTLASLLIFSAGYLEGEGRLDAALERYLGALRIAGHLRHRTTQQQLADEIEREVYTSLPRWAARPNQTSPRVLAALGQLDKTIAALPSRADAIKTEYVFGQRFLDGDPKAIASFGDLRESRAVQLLLRVLFWERYRTLRQLNRFTAEQLAAYERAEREAAAGGIVRFIYSEGKEFGQPMRGKQPPERERSSLSSPEFAGIFFGMNSSLMEDGLVRIETERRATRLVMALEAWKLDHGKLPKSLDELRGKYLAQIPVDLVWGRPFRYFPDGLRYPVGAALMEKITRDLKPGQPWIAAPLGRVTDRPGYLILELHGGRQEFHMGAPPPTAEQLDKDGLVFPIP